MASMAPHLAGLVSALGKAAAYVDTKRDDAVFSLPEGKLDTRYGGVAQVVRAWDS